jgi:hypothetical protein
MSVEFLCHSWVSHAVRAPPLPSMNIFAPQDSRRPSPSDCGGRGWAMIEASAARAEASVLPAYHSTQTCGQLALAQQLVGIPDGLADRADP